MPTADLLNDASTLLPDVVALRRAIHADPELGLQTPKTRDRVRAALAGLPLRFLEGPSTTGLVAVLEGAAPGRTVLLRGDMDALPMPEETGLDFASRTPGVMHACGHDAHAAMLVGAARLLAARRESLAGRVLFMFQPGEEGWHGALHMINDGLLEPAPDAAFALHISPNSAYGAVISREGPLLASADTLRIVVEGRGGHAAMPHDAVDPVPIACEIVQAIQTIVTRRINVFDPAVVTVGKISAGSTFNVIPETAELLGTIRTISPGTRNLVHAELRRVAEKVAEAHGARAVVEIERGFPPTVCDPRGVAVGRAATTHLFGEEAWSPVETPIMGAEDFSYVLERVPGAFFFLGAAPPDADPHACCACHSTRMQFEESIMARGVALHVALAERFLAEGFA